MFTILVSLNSLPLTWTPVFPGYILVFLLFFILFPTLHSLWDFFFPKLVSLPCPNLSFEHTLVDIQRSCYKDQSSKTNSKYLPFILSPSSLSINPCLNPPQSFFYNESTIARGRAWMHSPFLCLKCLYPKSSPSQLYHIQNLCYNLSSS